MDSIDELIELILRQIPVEKNDKVYISFKQNEFDLEIGDAVYSLTDSLPNQFGGD